jgi:hypothetical protein
MAAKGRLPDKAPQVTLDGANKRQARIRASVEMTTVTKLLACGKKNVCRSCGKIIVVSTVWFTRIPPTFFGHFRLFFCSAPRLGGRFQLP